jgi:uncharacterized protein with ParB-like and HNH nuclease domain
MTKFANELNLLPELFKDKFFIIPDYQRGYAWEEKQVVELLRDIEYQVFDGLSNRHYTGTLVLLQNTANGNGFFEVVDGQQRLATISILLACIRDKFLCNKNVEIEKFNNLYLIRGGVGDERPVLKLNSETQKIFEECILYGKSSSDLDLLASQTRILSAKIIINDWLDGLEKRRGVTFEVLMNTINTELGFLIYCPSNDVETGVMFEVINNRGQQLSELEKVKNYLIYCSVKLGASKIRDEINDAWALIIRRLNCASKTSLQDETAFLRYCLVVFFKSGVIDSKSGYEVLKSEISISNANINQEELKTNIRNFVNFLVEAALTYEQLFSFKNEVISKELRENYNLIASQPSNASIMPLFIAIVQKKTVDKSNVLNLIKLLEILNFRVFVAPGIANRSDSGQARLYKLAYEYYHNTLALLGYKGEAFNGLGITKPTQDEILEFELLYFVYEFSVDNKGSEDIYLDEKFKNAFSLAEDKRPGFDYYRWEGLKYFLLCYEQFVNNQATVDFSRLQIKAEKGRANDALSTEHIWPKQYYLNKKQVDRPKDSFQKRRLGNFVLLEHRKNIKGSNDSPEVKFDNYYNGWSDGEVSSSLHQVKKVKIIIDKEC